MSLAEGQICTCTRMSRSLLIGEFVMAQNVRGPFSVEPFHPGNGHVERPCPDSELSPGQVAGRGSERQGLEIERGTRVFVGFRFAQES